MKDMLKYVMVVPGVLSVMITGIIIDAGAICRQLGYVSGILKNFIKRRVRE